MKYFFNRKEKKPEGYVPSRLTDAGMRLVALERFERHPSVFTSNSFSVL